MGWWLPFGELEEGHIDRCLRTRRIVIRDVLFEVLHEPYPLRNSWPHAVSVPTLLPIESQKLTAPPPSSQTDLSRVRCISTPRALESLESLGILSPPVDIGNGRLARPLPREKVVECNQKRDRPVFGNVL